MGLPKFKESGQEQAESQQDVGAAYQGYWEETLALHESHARNINETANRLRIKLGEAPGSSEPQLPGELLATKAETIIWNMVLRLVGTKEDGQLNLDIDREATLDKYLSYRARRGAIDEVLNFSPMVVWADLSQTYTDQAIHKRARAALAEKLVSGLWISERNRPQERGGRVVFTVGWSMCDYGNGDLSVYSYQHLRNLFSSLGEFLELIGEQDAADALKLHHLYNNISAKVISRNKHDCAGKLQITTYFKKSEWAFAPAVANQLRLFIAKYGASE